MDQKAIKSDLETAEEQKKHILTMIGDNAGLLEKIGEEIEQLSKENGGNEMEATLEVAEKYKEELEKLKLE